MARVEQQNTHVTHFKKTWYLNMLPSRKTNSLGVIFNTAYLLKNNSIEGLFKRWAMKMNWNKGNIGSMKSPIFKFHLYQLGCLHCKQKGLFSQAQTVRQRIPSVKRTFRVPWDSGLSDSATGNAGRKSPPPSLCLAILSDCICSPCSCEMASGVLGLKLRHLTSRKQDRNRPSLHKIP